MLTGLDGGCLSRGLGRNLLGWNLLVTTFSQQIKADQSGQRSKRLHLFDALTSAILGGFKSRTEKMEQRLEDEERGC